MCCLHRVDMKLSCGKLTLHKNKNLFCVFAKLLLSKYAALFQHPQNHLNYARPQAIPTTTALTCPLDLAVDMDADWWGLCLDHS